MHSIIENQFLRLHCISGLSHVIHFRLKAALLILVQFTNYSMSSCLCLLAFSLQTKCCLLLLQKNMVIGKQLDLFPIWKVNYTALPTSCMLFKKLLQSFRITHKIKHFYSYFFFPWKPAYLRDSVGKVYTAKHSSQIWSTKFILQNTALRSGAISC